MIYEKSIIFVRFVKNDSKKKFYYKKKWWKVLFCVSFKFYS